MKILLMLVSIAFLSIVVMALIAKAILPAQIDLNWALIYITTMVGVAMFACGFLMKEKQ